MALVCLFSPTVAVPQGLTDDASTPPIVVRGTVDPALRKAAAIVNGAVVTDLDVDQRLALVLLASGVRLPPDEQVRLRAQILRNLIDERLQIQESREHDVTVEEGQVEDAFRRVAENFRQSPDQFDAFLRSNGTSKVSLTDQIRAELAWSRLLRRRVEPLINVGDDEVEAIIARLKAARGQDEYRLGEIFLASAPETADEVNLRANQIISAVRSGASFVAYARQFSEAATAAVGGDRGWVAAPQLDPGVRDVVAGMSVGQVIGPVPVANGVYIFQLNEKRKVLEADPLDSTVSAKQIALALPQGASVDAAEAVVQRLGAGTRSIGGCGRVEEVANALGGKVSDIPEARIRDLPQGLHRALLDLRIGEATEPFGTRQEARVIVLCGRDAPSEAEPSFDEVYAQINEQRVSLMARRYLRDLRSDAIVDYR
jgi:peptidyl-prolyl cis-trans isomerase SurA